MNPYTRQALSKRLSSISSFNPHNVVKWVVLPHFAGREREVQRNKPSYPLTTMFYRSFLIATGYSTSALSLNIFLNSVFIFGLCWVFTVLWAFSSCSKRTLFCCSVRASYSDGFFIAEPRLLGWEGFSCCGTWAQQLQLFGMHCRAQAH